MADAFIQLSPDSTGKKVDTENLTVGADSVHRERMQIAGDSPTDIAPVTAADGLLVNLGTNNDVTIAGGSTLAEQQAQTALLTTIDGDTGTLAGAVAGSEVQVDVVAALPAGNNNIGDVDIASLPNEGQQNMAGSISVAIASDQSAIPVSGTVAVTGSSTLAEQQTQTTHLAAIETAVEILDNAIAGSEMQVDVVTSALPTGASTLGEQQTQTTHLAAIETAVEILDNAIAGSEMQVDIVAALPAGTNNIGDVDVLSSALPAGASTLAEQQSQTTHLATIAGDTTAIETAVQIMDDWDESDRAKVNLIVGQAGVAAGAGATGATVIRVVEANGAGKTILSAGGSAASSGNNTLVAAGSARLKVVAFSLTTLSTTAMTCIFQSGASGTELWRVVIQAPTGVSAGANLSTTVPGWLFATASATLLNLSLSSANAVHWSVSYYDEA